MKTWSTGELGIMWLGVGIALVVVAPVGFDGVLTVIAVVAGIVALVYGGVLAWRGMRKDPAEQNPDSEDQSPREDT